MSELGKRIVSGVLLAAIVALCIFWGVVPLAIGTFILSALALSEFYRLLRIKGYVQVFGYLFATALFVLVLVHVNALGISGDRLPKSLLFAPLLALFFFHAFGHLMGQAEVREDSLRYQSGGTVIGYLWISSTLATAILIRGMEAGEWWLLFGVLVTAVNDVAAFGVGKRWGKHKLAPSISPGKSVEGFIGGAVFAMLTAAFMSRMVHVSVGTGVGLGGVLAFLAVGGDLLESYFKRKCGVKDSGSLIAGHGGVLDRIDAYLLTIPALYLFLRSLR